MNAKITAEFIVKNVCNQEDLGVLEPKECKDLDSLVRFLINEEGLFGIVEDDFKVTKVEEVEEVE